MAQELTGLDAKTTLTGNEELAAADIDNAGVGVKVTAQDIADLSSFEITDGSITEAKLNATINASLDLADSALQSVDVVAGIPNGALGEDKLSASVNASLDKADSSLQNLDGVEQFAKDTTTDIPLSKITNDEGKIVVTNATVDGDSSNTLTTKGYVDSLSPENNTDPSVLPKWDGDSFENSIIYEGYLDTISDTSGTAISEMVFNSSTEATTITFTLENALGQSLSSGDIVHLGVFTAGIPGFGGVPNTSLQDRYGTITTLTSQTSFVVTIAGEPVNVGVTTVPSGIQELLGYSYIITRANNSMPLLIDGSLSVVGDSTFSQNVNINGIFSTNIQTINAGGSTTGNNTYKFVIVPNGVTITSRDANTIYLEL